MMQLMFSVDLEPNKDRSVDGVADAMAWYDRVVPSSTVYATYRIAEELPGVLKQLARNHEIGVHVHPREFGHEHDQLAQLPEARQRDVIEQTRVAVAAAIDVNATELTAFRAGRHSADLTTLDVIRDLGFVVDASANLNYEWLPEYLARASGPTVLGNGLLEIPTSYYEPSLFSMLGLRRFDNRTVTATASTLRSDSVLCSGVRAVESLFARADGVVSMYMHPYDATTHHRELQNAGQPFRNRIEHLFSTVDQFVTASEIAAKQFAGNDSA